MAIITKIEAQKKNTDRVNIYINDEFFIGVVDNLQERFLHVVWLTSLI